MAETQQQHSSDSIDEQDPSKTEDKKQKSRRPANTAFRQQRLKAWQPILTPKTVLPLFFVIGIIFAPIGGVLLWASAQVNEIVIDYSRCFEDAPVFPETAEMNKGLITKNLGSGGRPDEPTTWTRRTAIQHWGPGADVETTMCTIQFGVPKNITAPVLFYYKLTNFYQNHRRYAKSFSIDQLSGDAVSAGSIDSGDCQPLTTGMDNGVKKPYYPCGLAANSQFNDTFESPVQLDPQFAAPGEINRTYTMNDQDDISWASDRALYGDTKYKWEDVLVPPNWQKRYPNNYSDEYHPRLKEEQHFQVWMRLAGLPTFSKLYMRNDNDDMAAGTYTINIYHNFPVTEYGGTKSIIITSKTVMGGKNPFLGIAYIVVGGICVVLGVLFTVTHLIKPRKLGDHTYLSWNNDQPSTATTTGRDGGPGAEQRA